MTFITKKSFTNFWKENKSLLLFISLMLVFRSAVADWNDVPTGSMNPTIIEGDRIYVDKLAYDLRVPFTLHSLIKFADPQRNDIIIFESEVADKRLVKRVIGIPGDIVAMKNNKLYLNGEAVQYPKNYAQPANTPSTEIIVQESITEENHSIRLNNVPSALANFSAVKVPHGHYLVLGDNRDNSADSRVIGFVPRNEIIGRSNKVVLSLNYDNYFMPRAERFFIDI